ncbi:MULTISPECIES: type IV secretory system conjugative DNA transfer family protein [Microbispora]|uniref:Type IV secretion system DNA-binding domain-containig protein n=3 Tax=Microbispora TaxID=2005 RepID=A0ABY3LU52_9ACTN|nr:MULTISPECIES: type IV secretory system conjugative DNA transfer family protein [Microbispora]KAA9375976.1 type IV secretion system DNA-binding domain-containing protein [Microbispora cellulosiformans]TLP57866.1 DUF87 domain-containing protein [Microbispora fusca]TYB52334.1 type IV secretion system DNA-binding domain-containig protein [Microbispora tritici]
MSACLLCDLDDRDVQAVLDFFRELPARLPEFFLTYGWKVALVVAVALSALAMMRGALARVRHAWLKPGARLIEISSPPECDPKAALVFWSQLIGLLRPAWKRALHGQPHLAWEYLADEAGIRIRMWVPGVVPPGLVEKAIQAAWPGATVTTRPSEPSLFSGFQVAGGHLVLGSAEHFPLKTDHASDPIRPLLTAVSGLRSGEQAIVQILARPATGRRLRRAHRAAAALRGAPTSSPIGQVLDELAPMSGHARPGELTRMFPERAEQVRAILTKSGQSRYQIALRYAVTSIAMDEVTRERLRGQAHTLAGVFAVFTSGHQYLRRRRLPRPASVLALRRMDGGYLLSVSELAALAHLPWDADAPGITRASARPIAPSPAVPRGGAPGTVRMLGDADSGPARPVALTVADARHHVHVLGATGVGKSTLLASMILSDAEAGRGALVIDPKGDLITDVLARLPGSAVGRTVVFDPQDPARPPAINVLAGPDPAFAVDSIVTIFHRCFSSAWGPRVDDLLRSTCLTLTKVLGPRATLADVPRLLTDSAYRTRVTARLDDELLRGFWDSYQALTPAGQASVIGPVMNKLRAVLLRPFIRRALTSPATTVPIGQLLDRGGLILARLPKGILGDDAARLFGSILLAHTWQAATRRATLTETDRRDAALYIDECHNFLNLPGHINDVLAEARGYRLSLVLAHQHLDQLPADLREALSADARNKIYFSVSPKDAGELKTHTAPLVTPYDLAHLGAFQAVARLVATGQQTPAFTLRTRPLPPVVPGREAAIRQASRDRFTTPANPTGTAAAGRASEQHARRKARRSGRDRDPRAD